jgi:hypothetical protein
VRKILCGHQGIETERLIALRSHSRGRNPSIQDIKPNRSVVGQFQYPQPRFSIAFRGIIEPCHGEGVGSAVQMANTTARIIIPATIASIMMPWRVLNRTFTAAV